MPKLDIYIYLFIYFIFIYFYFYFPSKNRSLCKQTWPKKNLYFSCFTTPNLFIVWTKHIGNQPPIYKELWWRKINFVTIVDCWFYHLVFFLINFFLQLIINFKDLMHGTWGIWESVVSSLRRVSSFIIVSNSAPVHLVIIGFRQNSKFLPK
jgi:hypothetical protein